jgi:hypothetical protein
MTSLEKSRCSRFEFGGVRDGEAWDVTGGWGVPNAASCEGYYNEYRLFSFMMWLQLLRCVVASGWDAPVREGLG